MFENACCESYSRFVCQKREEDTQYQDITLQIQKLLETIRTRLHDQQELVEELDDLQGEQCYIREQWIYQQGFRDYFYLLRRMDAFHEA